MCGVCVCFDLFQDDSRYLFSPHQVNHGDVQKVPTQVSLSRETLVDDASTTSEGLCRWAPVGLVFTLEAGFVLRERTRRNPWMWS